MNVNKRSLAFSFLKLFTAAFVFFLAEGRALPQDATNSPQIKQTSVNGIKLSYQEQGRGRPVVFVHGAISDFRLWNAQREAVAPHYHFVALTQRYFGTSPWPDDGSRFSIATHADDLAEFIRELNAGPVDLVGWSYSGPIVLLAALQHPELVRSLFMYEPSVISFVTDPADLKAASDDRKAIFTPAAAASKAGDSTQATRLLIGAANGQPDYFDTAAPALRSIWLDNARTVSLMFAAPTPPPISCEQLGKMKIPVTIARGELTRPYYRIAADTAAQCIPSSKVVIIPRGRHLTPVQDAPAFNAGLLSFLK